MLAGKQALTRTYANHDNERERFHDKTYDMPGNNYLPAAALAIGLGLTAQHAMEEQEDSFSIDKLDMNDVHAVITVFKNGTEDEKRELAQRIGQKITKYKVKDIISFLQHTEKRPHRTIVNALAKNIAQFTPKQISQILAGDTQDETHDLIASTLNKHYNYFTGYTFGGYRLYSTQDGLFQYAEIISSLKEKYQSKAIKPLADDLDHIDTRTGLSLGWNTHEILQKAPEQGKQIIIRAILQNYSNNKAATAAEINYWIGFNNLLKHCNEQNADIITAIITENITTHHILRLFGVLEASADKNKKNILSAIVQNIDKGGSQHLDDILTTLKNKYLSRHDIAYIIDILKVCNEQNQAIITATIAGNMNNNRNRVHILLHSSKKF